MWTISLVLLIIGAVSAQLPPYYQQLTALEKQTMLYRNIASFPYPILPKTFLLAPLTDVLFTGKVAAVSFTHDGDEMPFLRPRWIHTFGTAGKVSMDIFSNSTYTGIFKAGLSNVAIARLSLMTPVNNPDNFGPSIAVKILQDKKPSVNLQAMVTPDGQGKDRNWFANPLTNFIPPPQQAKNIAFAAKLRAGIAELADQGCGRPIDERKLPLLQCAAADVGMNSSNTKINAPTIIKFVPNSALAFSSTSMTDFRTQLAKIPVNSVLYKIAVKATPEAEDEVIGQLLLKSPLVASPYTDNNLFFRHANMRCLA